MSKSEQGGDAPKAKMTDAERKQAQSERMRAYHAKKKAEKAEQAQTTENVAPQKKGKEDALQSYMTDGDKKALAGVFADFAKSHKASILPESLMAYKELDEAKTASVFVENAMKVVFPLVMEAKRKRVVEQEGSQVFDKGFKKSDGAKRWTCPTCGADQKAMRAEFVNEPSEVCVSCNTEHAKANIY